MAECRLPRGVVFFANAVDHDCRNEARPYCCGVENSVALTTKGCSEHGGPTDRSSDLTKQSFRTGIANLCFAVTPTDSAAQPTFSVPDRHQTKPHPARTSIEAGRHPSANDIPRVLRKLMPGVIANSEGVNLRWCLVPTRLAADCWSMRNSRHCALCFPQQNVRSEHLVLLRVQNAASSRCLVRASFKSERPRAGIADFQGADG